jgi:oxygen-dependent protoporphyrinogen oxidase
MSDIAVVGSGAAGLAAAYRLREAGHNVRILERNARLGGKMLTTRKLGFTLEEGPSAMAGSYHSILGIAREAGMGADLVPASGRIALPGPEREMHYLDPTRIVKDGYRTSLISTRAKIRLARLGIDLFRTRSRRKPYDLSLLEEFDGVSAEQYSRSRLGDELTDYLVDPCIRSFVNCGSSEVSAADLLYVFGAFMGSSEYVAFRHGMSSYAERIGALCEVTLEAEVCAVRDRGTVVEVTWRGPDGADRTEEFAGVVVASDANTAGSVCVDLDPWRRELLTEGVAYTWSTVVHVALQEAPPVDSCFIFPRASKYPNLMILSLEHNKTPMQVPAGKGLVGVYPSSAHARELYDLDDDAVAKDLITEAEELIPGLGEDVMFTHVSRWHPTLLQSRPGYWRLMREFMQRSEATDRGVQFAGDYFCTSSLNTASASGERAAQRLASHQG